MKKKMNKKRSKNYNYTFFVRMFWKTGPKLRSRTAFSCANSLVSSSLWAQMGLSNFVASWLRCSAFMRDFWTALLFAARFADSIGGSSMLALNSSAMFNWGTLSNSILSQHFFQRAKSFLDLRSRCQ